jgi:hypothetical protein
MLLLLILIAVGGLPLLVSLATSAVIVVALLAALLLFFGAFLVWPWQMLGGLTGIAMVAGIFLIPFLYHGLVNGDWDLLILLPRYPTEPPHSAPQLPDRQPSPPTGSEPARIAS